MSDKNYLDEVIPKVWINHIKERLDNKIFNLEATLNDDNYAVSFNVENYYGEDKYCEFEISNSLDGEERQRQFAKKIEDIYLSYDVDEEVEMWMEAKRNGMKGIPSAINLVNNCKEINNNLKEFSDTVNYYLLSEKLDYDFSPKDARDKTI